MWQVPWPSRQTSHDQEVVGSSPGTVYKMDVSDASYYVHKHKNKGSQMGHTKKKIKGQCKTTGNQPSIV